MRRTIGTLVIGLLLALTKPSVAQPKSPYQPFLNAAARLSSMAYDCGQHNQGVATPRHGGSSYTVRSHRLVSKDGSVGFTFNDGMNRNLDGVLSTEDFVVLVRDNGKKQLICQIGGACTNKGYPLELLSSDIAKLETDYLRCTSSTQIH